MQVEVTFEELDWKCNLVREVRKFKYSWNPDLEMLMRASVENDPACIGFPFEKDHPTDFLKQFINYDHLRSCVKAIAHFKGWDLVVFERDSPVMRWEAT